MFLGRSTVVLRRSTMVVGRSTMVWPGVFDIPKHGIQPTNRTNKQTNNTPNIEPLQILVYLVGTGNLEIGNSELELWRSLKLSHVLNSCSRNPLAKTYGTAYTLARGQEFWVLYLETSFTSLFIRILVGFFLLFLGGGIFFYFFFLPKSPYSTAAWPLSILASSPLGPWAPLGPPGGPN